MIDVEPLIVSELERMLPLPDGDRADWADVVRRAHTLPGARRDGRLGHMFPARVGVPRRRRRGLTRRRLIIAVAVAVAVLIPLTAVASVSDWWLFRIPQSQVPTSAPVIVKSGVWDGRAWRLVAFPSTTDGLCLSIVPGTSSSANSFGAAMNCGPFAGVPRTGQTNASPDMTITYLSGGPTTALPAYITGPVIEQATTVEIRLVDGTTIKTPTFAGPPPLDHTRFYAVQIHGSGTPLTWVAGLDASGRIVACLDPSTATDGISPLSACR